MKIDEFIENVGLPAVTGRIAYSITIRYIEKDHRFHVTTTYAGSKDSHMLISSIDLSSPIFDKIIKYIPRKKSMERIGNDLYHNGIVMHDFELVNLKRIIMIGEDGKKIVGNDLL